jgi:transcriptional repressor NrdR
VHCPYCQHHDTRVIDSRLAKEGRAIRRRRQCETCHERFTTFEIPEETMVEVEKRDGQTEMFDAEKLLKSIRLACKKRPVRTDIIATFVEQLEARLMRQPRRVVSSREVGDQVLTFLRGVDPVAYVRYASVYRSFGSVDEFMREIQSLTPNDGGGTKRGNP